MLLAVPCLSLCPLEIFWESERIFIRRDDLDSFHYISQNWRGVAMVETLNCKFKVCSKDAETIGCLYLHMWRRKEVGHYSVSPVATNVTGNCVGHQTCRYISLNYLQRSIFVVWITSLNFVFHAFILISEGHQLRVQVGLLYGRFPTLGRCWQFVTVNKTLYSMEQVVSLSCAILVDDTKFSRW